MPPDYAYHSKKPDRDIYHLCRNCTEGNNIEPENRCSGKGNKKKRCKHCEKLIQNNQCNKESEESVKSREKGLEIFRNIKEKNPNLK